MGLTPADIQRYVRRLPLIAQQGQARLLQARILCIGAGWIRSSVVAIFNSSGGIGTVGIVDGDCVELSNLQRQVIFTPEDIGKNKASEASCYFID